METFFPSTIITYLELFAPLFAANNFLYFRGFVLGQMLLGTTRKCLTRIAQVCFFLDRHLSSWERFVAQYQWDINGLRQRLLELLKQELGQKLLICGGYLAWVDTTLIAKVKGAMPGVQKWRDHSGNSDRGEHLVGHHWALVGLLGTTYLAGKLTPLCWPLLANLIPGNSNPFGFVVGPDGVAQAMSFWDAVCQLIAHLQQMLGAAAPLRVVADAYFSKAPFINWMLSLKAQVITRMRSDAVGWDDPEPEAERAAARKKRGPKPRKPQAGRRWKIAELLKLLPPTPVSVFIYGKLERLEVVSRDLWIRGVIAQKVRVVVIKRIGEPLILLCTDLSLSVEEIIQIYGLRYSLELSIRDSKQYFGLGDYQCRSFLAMTRFVGLSLLSLCLWRLALLKNVDADWLQLPEETALLSFNRVSRGLRRWTLQQVFRKFTAETNLANCAAAPEEIIRLIA